MLAASGTQLAADFGGRLHLAEGSGLTLAPAGPVFVWGRGRVPWIVSAAEIRDLRQAQALIVTAALEPLALADALVAVNPRVVILLSAPISPPPELGAALAERTVLALDLRGDVTLMLAGERLWVETER